MVATWDLQQRGVPNLLVTPIVVGVCVVLVALLEQVRPERAPLPRDFSLFLEAAHFVCNFELGYGLALVAIELLETGLRVVVPVAWPTSWPIPVQLLFLLTLYEASSYWQHRLFHHRRWLWAFHALHHSGARLDLLRAGRFHFVDFATVAFMAYLPLAILGSPESLITMMAVLVSVLGLLHHGNVRQRTPRWLDLLICTPAVHRLHHSKVASESNANYGNTVMLFDLMFGTYARPHPIGPERMGIEDDPLPAGFWAQFLGPFRGQAGVGEVAVEGDLEGPRP